MELKKKKEKSISTYEHFSQLFEVYKEEDLPQAKETLKWLHKHNYHTQANAHHQGLHGTESMVAFSKHTSVTGKVQPCLHSLAKCEPGCSHFEGMGSLDPTGQSPTSRMPL